MLSLPEATLQPAKYGLLVAGYLAAFILVSKNWDMFRRKHFTLGIGAQFLYVAAQTGIFSFFVNYVLENDTGVTKLQASHWLGLFGFGLFMFGRLCGSGIISQCKPHLVLAIYAIINVALSAVVMGGGKPGLIALFGRSSSCPVMFPTIFALGIRGLGDYTKLGFLAYRHVHRRRGNCAAVYGSHRGCSFHADWHGRAAGLLRVYCYLWIGLAETGGQGRGAGNDPVMNYDGAQSSHEEQPRNDMNFIEKHSKRPQVLRHRRRSCGQSTGIARARGFDSRSVLC